MRDRLPIISFDIDGVINNYPICFILFVNNLLNADFTSIEEIKMFEDYKTLKHIYRLSDYKYNVEIDSEIRDVINELYNNFQIKIFTSRPFHNYSEMYNRTKLWLDKNNVLYDGLFSKNLENFTIRNVLIHLDDETNHIKLLLESKETQFIVLEEGLNEEFKNVHYIKSKMYVKDKIYQILSTIL